jgi:hypothetical protein
MFRVRYFSICFIMFSVCTVIFISIMFSVCTVIIISGSFIFCKNILFELGSLSTLRLKTSLNNKIILTFSCSYSSWYSPVEKTMLVLYNMHSIATWTNTIVLHVFYYNMYSIATWTNKIVLHVFYYNTSTQWYEIKVPCIIWI